MAGDTAARRWRRANQPSSTADSANRATVNQPGGSQVRPSLVSGTVVPQSTPEAARAAREKRWLVRMPPWSMSTDHDLTVRAYGRTIVGEMATSLDEIDVQLLVELQADADRTNVDLARLVGLSPAATLHRVRRLKESGVIRQVVARLDPAVA